MQCLAVYSTQKGHAGQHTAHFFSFVDLLTPPLPPIAIIVPYIHTGREQQENKNTDDRTAQAEPRHACGAEVPKKEKAREGASKMAVHPGAASGVDPLRLLITGLRTMLLLLSLWELALSNFLPEPPKLAVTTSSSVAGTVSGILGGGQGGT